MPRRIITLTTDFGLSDHFVGTMKGVILGILPTAEIVDITHGVTAFGITEAAFLIAQAYPYFPRRTVHVVVVDPGVGTARRPILVEAAGQYFIAPDNGVLSMVYAHHKHKARHITAKQYFLSKVSNTFHGRDVFAPVAAHLAKGARPAQLGKLISDHLRTSFGKPVRTGRRTWTGTILKVDHFGNLITNFHVDDFPGLRTGCFEVTTGLRSVTRLASSYAEGEPGEPLLIAGSSGYFEVVTHQASTAKMLGCGAGAPVDLVVL